VLEASESSSSAVRRLKTCSSIGGDDVAFDLFAKKGDPVISTQANTMPIGRYTAPWGIDIDIILPSDDPDSFFPPGTGYFCMKATRYSA
jgi:hypothetical protein